METVQLADQARPFLDYLQTWMNDLPTRTLVEVFPDPARAAILSVDVINGFCYEGPLSSPRVAGIVDPIARLFQSAWEFGVRQIVLTQDTHDPAAVEFAQWPPHCVRGTSESETVPAFKALPFYDRMVILPKNSIDSALNTGLQRWLNDHPDVRNFVVVGDCTDLCTYQLAMFLRLDANARQLERRVTVMASGVDTYDMLIETAAQVGAMPHPAGLLHPLFLYHMALNGVEVVKDICP
ncbi:MAG TPA: isochorismatase family cysteine hydrolase [Anaerolineaceae bacterium]|nr:isochorismatase family cysteine hydrolase [Anaerolineaceae bacterium]